jgi:hypothetical protein
VAGGITRVTMQGHGMLLASAAGEGGAMIPRLRTELSDLVWIVRSLALLTVAAALYQELRRPPDKRTWHGRLFGFVPYDFRLPTLDRLRQAYWNTGSNKVFTDRPLGVGWAVNLPPLLRRLGFTISRRRQTASN